MLVLSVLLSTRLSSRKKRGSSMMQIDTGLLSVIITVLLAIISLAAWMGSLSQKVRGQGEDIEINRKLAEKERERIHIENRQDHQQIFSQLKDIENFIRNGKRNAG